MGLGYWAPCRSIIEAKLFAAPAGLWLAAAAIPHTQAAPPEADHQRELTWVRRTGLMSRIAVGETQMLHASESLLSKGRRPSREATVEGHAPQCERITRVRSSQNLSISPSVL